MLAFGCGSFLWFGHTVLTIRGNRNDPAASERGPQRVTIVAFIEPQAFGAAATFPDFDAIDRFEHLHLVMAIGFTQSHIQRIAVGIDDQVAFKAANPVFSRVSDLVFGPLFDLMTLASW